MLMKAQVIELMENLGKATGLVQDDGMIHDTTEFFEACCDLFGINVRSGNEYLECVSVRNATAFAVTFIGEYAHVLRAKAWLQYPSAGESGQVREPG